MGNTGYQGTAFEAATTWTQCTILPRATIARASAPPRSEPQVARARRSPTIYRPYLRGAPLGDNVPASYNTIRRGSAPAQALYSGDVAKPADSVSMAGRLPLGNLRCRHVPSRQPPALSLPPPDADGGLHSSSLLLLTMPRSSSAETRREGQSLDGRTSISPPPPPLPQHQLHQPQTPGTRTTLAGGAGHVSH